MVRHHYIPAATWRQLLAQSVSKTLEGLRGLNAGRGVRDHRGSYPVGGKGSMLEGEMINQICQRKRRAATNMLPHPLHCAQTVTLKAATILWGQGVTL